MSGPAFEIGFKDTPIHVSRHGDIPRLKWLSTKLVLLWDDRDKRGWLINGTSALLHLEGWDFEDLATIRDPLHPRVATLEVPGKGWVDFTRAIQAVTLIGRGFGDIIRPAGANVCEDWMEVPKKQYYIASCLFDLRKLVREHGICDDNHVRLSDDLIWHTPTTVFEPCPCVPEQDHYEPVQTIFPLELSNDVAPRSQPLELEGNGAVIFGHSSNFSWIWGDTGPPQKGEMREAAWSSHSPEMDSYSLKDSGIGSSLAISGSASHASSRSMLSARRLTTSPSQGPSQTARADSAPTVDNKMHIRDTYTVGILCALPKELKAVRALFDNRHSIVETAWGDSNHYALGEMAQHMDVATCLPAGEYGTNSAAAAATNMRRSFRSLRFCPLVGIGGGVPSQKTDIRLGDVVVGLPTGTCPGVLQYDLGKEEEGKPLELTGTLQRPPRVLATAVNALRSDPDLDPEPLAPHLRKIADQMPPYRYPGRELTEPEIHYGPIASGNRVVKDAGFRDRLARERGVLCFEMEAAGVTNVVDCLVIRGICDYCDATKKDDWQEYAAAAAAACAKLLLSFVAKSDDDAIRGSVSRSLTERPMRLRREYEEEEKGWERTSKRRKL